ncbi:MAG: ABC transporter ATP-binding protein [Chloroflexi bacterium]|nr:ABC transporter ATP-binding protein [Chloroflexota bacterium]
MSIVEADDLHKRYGPVVAVDGVSFSVAPQEIFGILGPNGAGKTTTLEMIEGIRDPDGGKATVDGLEVKHHKQAVRERIGVQLQTTALFQTLTVEETIGLFASFYDKALAVSNLLSDLSLEDKKRGRVGDLSGGQRQRLSLALALVNDPKIVFLDEPTTGLDPQARRGVWELVRDLQKSGKTIVLTTHYMEEAEFLCDRVAIMDRAKIIALDRPQALINGLQAEQAIAFGLSDRLEDGEMRALPAVSRVARTEDGFILYSTELERCMAALIRFTQERGVQLNDLRIHRPTLEDVFITLTGRALRD